MIDHTGAVVSAFERSTALCRQTLAPIDCPLPAFASCGVLARHPDGHGIAAVCHASQGSAA